MDPDLVARGRLFVDSRAAALVESGDVVLGIQEGRFGADHIVAELGELLADEAKPRRRSDTEVTIFKSLGLAVEDVTAADLAYRRAVERGVGQELTSEVRGRRRSYVSTRTRRVYGAVGVAVAAGAGCSSFSCASYHFW